MATALIRVGLDELEGLEGRIRRLECAVDRSLSGHLSSSSARVADAYGDWLGKWTKNREEMTTALDGIANTVRSIIDAFTDVDVELASQLAPQGAP